MIEVFCAIDKKKLKAQTHCSLTAARGMVRMYAQTGEENYLKCAKDIFSLYIDSGMTYTYHNFNEGWYLELTYKDATAKGVTVKGFVSNSEGVFDQ